VNGDDDYDDDDDENLNIWIFGYVWGVMKHIFWVPSGCYESIILRERD
jgi:hypothetical protein